MVDHQIQSISPFFAKIEGETHHHKRYKTSPDLLAVGWMEAPDAQAETIFRYLVQRNAINWHANTFVSDVVLASQSDAELATSAAGWLADIRAGDSSGPVTLPAIGLSTPARGAEAPLVDVQRALLLVGSPRTRKSTSNSLGEYLFERLSAKSIQTETIYMHTALRSAEKTQALLDAVDTADLIVLSFPLYVDSMPAPVIEALERIAAHRKRRALAHPTRSTTTRRQLFAAIANSGFPEAQQSATALAICEAFSRDAGLEWTGALALGGGGVVAGTLLAEGGGKTMPMRNALDLAAQELAQGHAIPTTAQDLLGKPIIPHWLYRLMGNLGWPRVAKHFGASKLLRRRPYLSDAR
jgi:multimeric flavodoxin WrbA